VLLIETALTLLAIVIAFVYPSLGRRQFEAVEAVFSRLAQRRTLAVIAVGVTALALRAAVLPIEPIPEPIVHDEFGYLLAADTFAHGRLTNPTPPMWEHFETFSILMKPTYQCFAQPGQGMMLALGKVLFGHPFWGVWLSIGLMCAAITWMLQGWLSPEWALLGGALAILRYGVFGYWADSYWGGAVGAIGGALVLGALPRIKKSWRPLDALIMGTGLAILVNTRPYEGFVFSLPIAVILLVWLFRRDSPPFRITLPRVIAPLLIVLVFTAAGLGYYLWRVTGSPVRMPYEIEQKTYAVAPYMLWQHVHPMPTYNNPVIKKMYVDEALVGYQVARSGIGLLLKLYIAWNFFAGPLLSFCFVMLAFALPRSFSLRDVDRSTLALFCVLVISAGGCALESFYNPHYSAPATCCFIALVLVSLRCIRNWSAFGLFFTRAFVVVCILSFLIRAMAGTAHAHLASSAINSWYQLGPEKFGRSAVLKTLNSYPGNHLVLVRYSSEHEPFAEWVYNDAELNSSKVIWARELGLTDEKLIETFPNRKVWVLEADTLTPQLLPYSASDGRTFVGQVSGGHSDIR
jgi:hypothetical protein